MSSGPLTTGAARRRALFPASRTAKVRQTSIGPAPPLRVRRAADGRAGKRAEAEEPME
jgi:hypothetical protein